VRRAEQREPESLADHLVIIGDEARNLVRHGGVDSRGGPRRQA
jgi:hypothetical protein